MEPKEATAAQAKGDLLRNFERILHDDPLIDEVGFLHPTQFHSLLVDSANKSAFQYFWCTDHKLAISSDILPDLYRVARRAHSDATLNHPSSSPSASAAALIMMHSKALLILCPDLLTAWNSRKMVLSTNFNLSDLKDELRLCALILSYSPKNESTWSHRRWVIKKLAQHLQDMPELIDKESLLVKNIAEKSKMNYRAWRHRCWLIPYMKTITMSCTKLISLSLVVLFSIGLASAGRVARYSSSQGEGTGGGEGGGAVNGGGGGSGNGQGTAQSGNGGSHASAGGGGGGGGWSGYNGSGYGAGSGSGASSGQMSQGSSSYGGDGGSTVAAGSGGGGGGGEAADDDDDCPAESSGFGTGGGTGSGSSEANNDGDASYTNANASGNGGGNGGGKNGGTGGGEGNGSGYGNANP